MRHKLLCLSLLTLAGCAHSPRYVQIPCLTDEQYQELERAKPEKIGGKLTGKADEDIKPIAGRLIRVEAWGDGLLGVLKGCRGT